jgi:hypothetical protein
MTVMFFYIVQKEIFIKLARFLKAYYHTIFQELVRSEVTVALTLLSSRKFIVFIEKRY